MLGFAETLALGRPIDEVTLDSILELRLRIAYESIENKLLA